MVQLAQSELCAGLVSNSVAVDESGGIYLLTSAAMYRFDWDGSALSLGWRAEYQTAEEVPSPIRLVQLGGERPQRNPEH